MIGIADDALGTYFLAAKYFYVLLFALWVALVYRFRQAWILVGGTVLACVYAYLVVQAPLGRPYALYPGTDRTFNVAMGGIQDNPQTYPGDTTHLRFRCHVLVHDESAVVYLRSSF